MKNKDNKESYLITSIVNEFGVPMDKMIMGVENRDDVIVEHLDGDPYNCQRKNLRVVYLNKN